MDHFYTNIQGWFSYASIYDWAVEQATSPAHFVEIGSWRGRSTAYMAVAIANSGKQIKFDAIDTWAGSLSQEDHQQDPSVVNDTLYDEFLTNVAPAIQYITPIRLSSMEAVKQYEDDSLDFILVDGSHAYEDVKDDITHWIKKLKPGHFIAGDDYFWEGVGRAVDELIPTREVIAGDVGCWIYKKPII